MAKQIPKKKNRVVDSKNRIPGKKGVVKKKSARKEEIKELFDPKAQRRLERKVENYLIDLEERADERYSWAKALKEIQPDDVQAAWNRMVVQMARMAGPPTLSYEGRTYNADEKRLRAVQWKNHEWIAARLLVACAEWGIRVGNFKAPKSFCIRCGKKVKKAKKKVKK